MSSDLYRSFISLVRLGIGHYADALPQNVDWFQLKALAEQHGLSAVVLDGIERLPEQQRPPKVFLLEWIGETLQVYEYRYELYCRAIAEMAGFYNSHGYKMMVLKGYACSLDWPKPEHRPIGDIDIWQFRQQKEADALLSKEKGIEIDSSHHHHTVFYWRDYMVENHYDFLNIYHHQSNKEYEAILKECAKDERFFINLYGERVYLPSPSLHALFLLRHSMSNFASTGLLLRQLLDWAFFVEKHGKEIDWEWLLDLLDKFGMTPAFNIFNAICVEDLGFAPIIFHKVQFNPFLKQRVLDDILSKEFSEKERGGIINRVIYKYRRWKSNIWKHQLCFRDSLLSAFLSGVRSHLIKPLSI